MESGPGSRDTSKTGNCPSGPGRFGVGCPRRLGGKVHPTPLPPTPRRTPFPLRLWDRESRSLPPRRTDVGSSSDPERDGLILSNVPTLPLSRRIPRSLRGRGGSGWFGHRSLSFINVSGVSDFVLTHSTPTRQGFTRVESHFPGPFDKDRQGSSPEYGGYGPHGEPPEDFPPREGGGPGGGGESELWNDSRGKSLVSSTIPTSPQVSVDGTVGPWKNRGLVGTPSESLISERGTPPLFYPASPPVR